MQVLGFGGVFIELLFAIVKIAIKQIIMISKIEIKGAIKFLFDTLLFLEMAIQRIIHTFRR